ncbi:MAG: DUF1573 domain-containing protein [Thermoguttaceae bacterium]|jgi:hypothetical protein
MVRALSLACLLCTLLGSTASGQTWAEKMFQERQHDFGDIARGAKAEWRFELTNLYTEDVHVAAVRSSCGCTSLRIEKESLKTHETGAIIAKINSDRFLGQKGATVTVTFDKPSFATVQLHTRAYIRSDVVFQPGSVQIGAVAQGTPVDSEVEVAYAGRPDWQVLEVVSGSPHLSATVKEMARAGGQVRYQLRVHLDGSAPAGYLQEHLVLRTNDRNRTEVPVLVEARVEPPIVISPASLFMGAVEPGQSVTKTIVLRGATPFRILSIQCNGGSFRFELPARESEAKMIHVIPVTFTGSQTGGRWEQTIHVETDLGSPVPDLPAYAVVQ